MLLNFLLISNILKYLILIRQDIHKIKYQHVKVEDDSYNLNNIVYNHLSYHQTHKGPMNLADTTFSLEKKYQLIHYVEKVSSF